MKLPALLFIFVILIGPLSEAKNLFVFFGGGGEPADKENTIFDRAIPQINSFAKSHNYEADYYFTSQHAKSTRIAKESLGFSPPDFTEKSWKEKISQLERDIDQGKINSGSKIILAIDTHGTDRNGVFQMATVDGFVAPQQDLRQLIEKAEAKGVKIALIAEPCTSGNLLPVGSEKTCVITSSMPGQFGYTSDDFLGNLEKSKNMEDLFLRTRNEEFASGAASQPGISSPAGKKTQEVLRLLFPYMSEDEVVRPGSSELCHESSVIKPLNDLQKQFGPLVRPISLLGFSIYSKDDALPQLRDSMQKYNESSNVYRESLASSRSTELRCFHSPLPFYNFNGMGMRMFSPFVGMGGPKNEAEFKKMNALGSKESCVSSLFQVDLQLHYHQERLSAAEAAHASNEEKEKIKNTLQEIESIKNDETFKKALLDATIKEKENRARADTSLKTMLGSREKIYSLERIVYDQLYKKYSQELKDQKNPCSDFSL